MNAEQRIAQLLPHDKCLHFIAGVVVFACAHFSMGQDALYVVCAIAAAKEAADAGRHGDSSNLDIFATMAGGIVGYLCWLR